MKFLGPALPGAWERAADTCPYATFFHTPAWANIVAKSFPRLKAAAQAFALNGDTIIVPTMEYGSEAKGFFRALSSSHLGVYGGPIATRPLNGEELSGILEKIGTSRVKRVDIVGNPYAPETDPALCAGWTKRRNFTQVVPLDNFTTEKELTGRYVHLIRNSVNRAERRGYGLKMADRPGEILAYYELYKQALVRYGTSATGSYPLELFLNIFAESRDKAPIWLATHGDRVVGGVFSFVHNKRWVAWHSAFSEEEFPHGLAKWLHHRLILEAKKRGCDVYDFNPSGGHEGTVKFKEMYGTEKRYFWEVTREESPAYRAFRQFKKLAAAPVMSAVATGKEEAPPGVAVGTSSRRKTYAVAHFRTPYLSITETFIYGVLKHLKPPIEAVVFTEQLLNVELFPFPRIVNFALKKKSPLRLLNGVTNVVFGNNVALLGLLFAIHRVRLLHAHFGPQACDLVRIAKQLDIPLVTTFYGFDMSSGPKKAGWMERYKILFEAGDVFLVEGPHMFEKLVELGCPAHKVKVQRIGVDVASIPFRERAPKRAPEKVIFLFCGRMIEKKGLIYALQAFDALLAEGVDNFEFRVMGDGPLMAEMRAYLDSHPIGGRTTLLGYRPHADFLNELQKADVMVAPSVTGADGNSEGGAPTTILEAQAAGVPVVASLHADIPNVVLPGGSALLSPERDVASLKTNLRTMIENPDTWASFGRAGRAFVQANHDIATEVARLGEIYKRLIEAQTPGK